MREEWSAELERHTIYPSHMWPKANPTSLPSLYTKATLLEGCLSTKQNQAVSSPSRRLRRREGRVQPEATAYWLGVS